jgi:hypothetical protein
MKINDCVSSQTSNHRALSTERKLTFFIAFRFAAVAEINRDEDSVLTAKTQNESVLFYNGLPRKNTLSALCESLDKYSQRFKMAYCD